MKIGIKHLLEVDGKKVEVSTEDLKKLRDEINGILGVSTLTWTPQVWYPYAGKPYWGSGSVGTATNPGTQEIFWGNSNQISSSSSLIEE